MAGVVDRLGDAAPHPRGAADDAVQPRVRDHLDDRRHAAALLPQQPRGRRAELDLARGERARAELVLEPLELEAGAALDDEARQPARRLREDEEDVAHRVRAEPLVAGELVPPVACGLGARGAGAHVGAALLLRHRHPAQRAALVVGQRQARLPLRGQLGIRAQGGDGGVGHRDRAHHAGVGVGPQQLERRARDVRARSRRRARGARGSRARRRRAAASASSGRTPRGRPGGRSGRASAGAARCARPAGRARAPRPSRPRRRSRAPGRPPSPRPPARAPPAAPGRRRTG